MDGCVVILSAGYQDARHYGDDQSANDHWDPEVGEDRAGECDKRDPSKRFDVSEWVHDGVCLVGCLVLFRVKAGAT